MIRSLRAVKSLSLDRRRISSVLTTFRPTLDTNDDEHGTFPFFLLQTHALFHLLFATTCLLFCFRGLSEDLASLVSLMRRISRRMAVSPFSSLCNEISVWGSERSISKSNDGQRYENATESGHGASLVNTISPVPVTGNVKVKATLHLLGSLLLDLTRLCLSQSSLGRWEKAREQNDIDLVAKKERRYIYDTKKPSLVSLAGAVIHTCTR
jgi:hypothetical protein